MTTDEAAAVNAAIDSIQVIEADHQLREAVEAVCAASGCNW